MRSALLIMSYQGLLDITNDVDHDQLVKVLLTRFVHYNVSILLYHILLFGSESLSLAHTKVGEWRLSYTLVFLRILFGSNNF